MKRNYRKGTFVKIGQAAQILGVSITSLRRWEKEGKIETIRTPGGTRLYATKEIHTFKPQRTYTKRDTFIPPTPHPSLEAVSQPIYEPREHETEKPLSYQPRSVRLTTIEEKVDEAILDTPNNVPSTLTPPQEKRDVRKMLFIPSMITILLAGIFVVKANSDFLKSLLSSPQTLTQQKGGNLASLNEKKVLAASDSAHLLQINANTELSGNISVDGQGIFRGNLTAPNIIYGINAGTNVSVSPGQTPTISVNLPTLVSSVQGQTGAITFTAGTDIAISGTTISDSATLASVRGRGGCSTCITNEDIAHNLTINSDGNVAVAALNGTVPTSKGGTGLTSYTLGDLIYAAGTNTLAALPIGSNNQVLTVVSGVPTWAAQGGSGTNYWQQNLGVLSPLAITDDLAIGGTATSSAKFQVFANNGNIATTGVIAGLTGITSSGTITFSNFTSNGGILYTNGSGVLAQVPAGNASQCLFGGTTPSFGTCSTASSTNWWDQSNGALYPINSTLDLLVGGQATSSAKFAVINLAGGTPVATVSGNLIVMNNQGNGGNIGIGTTSPGYTLDVLGTGRLTGNLTLSGGITTLNNATSNLLTFGSNGVDSPSDTSNGWKTQLYANGTDKYGMGIDSNTLWSVANSNFDFYDRDNTTYNRKARLSLELDSVFTLADASNTTKVSINTAGDSYFSGGNVGINTTTTNADLAFAADIGDKIYLYDGGGVSRWGFGIQNWTFAMFMDPGNPGTGKFSWRNSPSSGDASTGTDVMNLYTTGHLDLLLNTANAVGLSIQGATSQTGNLQQWKDSNNNVLSEVTSSGNLGIGTTTPGGNLQVTGTTFLNGGLDIGDTAYYDPSVAFSVKSNRTYLFNMYSGSVSPLLALTQTGKLTIGDLTGGSKLNVFGNASIGDTYYLTAAPANGLLVQGNVGIGTTTVGSLLTIGSTGQFTVGSSGALATSGSVTFSSFTSNGGILYTNGSGVLAQATAGTSSQCLFGGTTPTFGSCATGTNYWNQANGALYPTNSTLDLLIGGQATSSAKFALTGIAGSLTPVATISATPSSGTTNGLAFGGDGTIQSLNRNTLKLGGSSTGDVVFSPGGTQRVTFLTGGNVGIGSTNPGGLVDINNSTANNVIVNLASTGDFVVQDAGSPFATFSDDGRLSIGTSQGTEPKLEVYRTDGSGFNLAARFFNASTDSSSTGTAANSGNISFRPLGNQAAQVLTTGTTTGQNVAGTYLAGGANTNYGGWFATTIDKNNATNVAVLGFARNTGTSPVQVGGYFGLQSTLPSFTSAALIADNGAETSPIFLARDNGSTIFTIIDGGNVGIGSTSPAAKLDIAATEKSLALTSSGITTNGLAGFSNTATISATGGGTYYGINNSVTNSNSTSANTVIGNNTTLTDNVALANTLVGSAVDLESSVNTAKTFTGFSSYGNITTTASTDIKLFSASATSNGLTGTNETKSIVGYYGLPTIQSGGTSVTNNVYGAQLLPRVLNSRTGTTSNIYGVYTLPLYQNVTTGGDANVYGIYLDTPVVNDFNGTTANYGLYMAEQGTNADTNYSLYIDSSADNYFNGNIGLGTTSPTNPIEHSSGAKLTAGGTWTNASDRNLKENFTAVDSNQILSKINQLPLTQWNYKAESPGITHIGPVAQDFYSLFGLGGSDKSISTIDPAGIALVGIQALSNQLRTLTNTNSGVIPATSYTILSQDGATKVSISNQNGLLTITNAAHDPTIQFNPETGSAYFSGELVAKTIRAEKIAGLEIITDKITSLTSQISNLQESLQASASSTLSQALQANFAIQASSSSQLQLDTVTIASKLHSVGQTFLGDTNIAGKLTVGTTTFDDTESSINTLGTLNIQNSPLAGNISLFSNAIQLAKTGDITLTGVLSAKTIKASELTITESPESTQSGFPAKVIGTGILSRGAKEVSISTTKVTSSSKVFITQHAFSTEPLVVASKQVGQGFTIAVKNTQDEDIGFDWWIVNTE